MGRTIVTTVMLLLTGCSGVNVPATKRGLGGSSNGADPSSTSNTGTTLPTADNLAKQQGELFFLQSLNGKLCTRLQQLRTQCVASAGLIPEANEQVLNCVSGVDAGAALQHSFEVEFQGPAGDFTMSANEEQYETTVFKSGAGSQKITWKEKFHQLTKAPRVLEIFEARLNGPRGKTLNKADIGTFRFKVNGQVVFAKANLVPTTSGNTRSLSIDLAKLIELQNSASCQVTDQEIIQLREQAQAEATSQENAQPNPAQAGLTTSQIQQKLTQVSTELERERSRKLALEKELGVKSNGGCWASVPINKLEILVDGAHLENSAAGTSKEAKENEGNALAYDFMFGETFKVSNPNENQNALFRPGGRLVSTDFSDINIGEINLIKIRKNGVSYVSNRQMSGCGLFGCSSSFINMETNITSLSTLRIKVNDQLVYERSGIGHTFDRDHREWADFNITRNPAYLALMLRNDCEAAN